MTKRELLEAVEPERVDEAKRPGLAADIRALARLAIKAEAKVEKVDKVEGDKVEAEADAPEGRVVGFQREVNRRDFP